MFAPEVVENFVDLAACFGSTTITTTTQGVGVPTRNYPSLDATKVQEGGGVESVKEGKVRGGEELRNPKRSGGVVFNCFEELYEDGVGVGVGVRRGRRGWGCV